MRINRHLHVRELDAPNLLEHRIHSPRPDGDAEHLLLDVLEAGVFHPLPVEARDVDPLAEEGAGLVELGDPLHRSRRAVARVVVAEDPGVVLLHLDPAAGPQVLHDLGVEARPVGRGAAEGAAVDVVEVLRGREGPARLEVVDVEFAVGGDPVRLDRGEVDAVDLGGGEFLGHVDGPDAGAAAEVEDAERRPGVFVIVGVGSSERCGVEAAADEEPPDVVLEV